MLIVLVNTSHVKDVLMLRTGLAEEAAWVQWLTLTEGTEHWLCARGELRNTGHRPGLQATADIYTNV